MRALKLTPKVLLDLNPEHIIYAEFAESGAMGDAGSTRFFILKDKVLKYYYFSIFDKRNKDYASYKIATKLLTTLDEKGVLQKAYAGFGNSAWKKRGAIFNRDDDNGSFIYKDGANAYVIPASNRGVYFHIVAEFAKRKVEIEKFESYLARIRKDLTFPEYHLFQNFIAQSKRNDSGISWFDLSPFDYINAVDYIKHITATDLIINNSEFHKVLSSMELYRLNYATEKLGWNKIDEIFSDIVLKGKRSVFQSLDNALGEHIEDVFSKLETVHTSNTSFADHTDNSFSQLFDRPVLVNFTPTAHRKIIESIQKMNPSSLRAHATTIANYFANYKFNEDNLSYAEVLPAVIHVIKYLPADDFNHTHTDQLFWVASDIIDMVWRYIDEDEKYQEKYRNLVYNLFWPRIGSVWPIAHFNEFKFNEPVAEGIFNDSLGFVLSLKDVLERNDELRDYFTPYIGNNGYANKIAAKAAFRFSLKGLDAKRQFDRIMANFEPEEATFFLTYPENIEEADFLLKELFKTEGNKFTGLSRLGALENLVITANSIGVGEYILKYLDNHYEEFINIIKTDIGDKYNLIATLTDYSLAISKGITEENEFAPFQSLNKKFIATGCNEATIKSAEKYARHHRRAILFQRSSLQKIF